MEVGNMTKAPPKFLKHTTTFFATMFINIFMRQTLNRNF